MGLTNLSLVTEERSRGEGKIKPQIQTGSSAALPAPGTRAAHPLHGLMPSCRPALTPACALETLALGSTVLTAAAATAAASQCSGQERFKAQRDGKEDKCHRRAGGKRGPGTFQTLVSSLSGETLRLNFPTPPWENRYCFPALNQELGVSILFVTPACPGLSYGHR